jgi:ABC-type transport system involved in Fe-S cluster assembly fused permease/ATPase subunit
MGLISNLRTFLWFPISQDGERRISLMAFDHMLELDLAFHLQRKTGAILVTTLCTFVSWCLPHVMERID